MSDISPDFRKWLSEFEGTMYPLFDDLEIVIYSLNRNNNSFWRRTYIRCLFAIIEADISMRTQLIIMSKNQGDLELTCAEESVLLEVQYKLKKNGEVNLQEIYYPLPERYRFTFRLAARALLSSFQIDCTGESWRNFQSLIKVRNRIMHPKKASDVSVSELEIDQARRLCDWLRDNSISIWSNSSILESSTHSREKSDGNQDNHQM